MKISALGAALVAGFLIPSCSSSDSGTAWHDFTSKTYEGLTEASTLGETAIPALTSPQYQKMWGQPKVRKSRSGVYELNYANPAQPFDRLAIYGSPKPFPALVQAPFYSKDEEVNGELTAIDHTQSFRTTTINGQPVRWFKESGSGGADGAYYSTTGFSLTDSSGRTGHYRLVVEGGDDMEAEVARRFSSVKLAR